MRIYISVDRKKSAVGGPSGSSELGPPTMLRTRRCYVRDSP
jgi:hypothetical protein